MRVLITVTHLLGTGHLRRAVTLARAFAAAGHRVRVVSGGTPVAGLATDGIDLVQLPPLASNGVAFTRLLTPDGSQADADYLARRQAALLDTLSFAPDVIITELFPFGRRVLRAEFMALLEAASGTLRLCSIRDILAPPSKPEKATATEAIIAAHYDGVLVHADPQAIPLQASWPVSDTLAPKLHYTGFVAPPAPLPHPDRAGAGEVLVSAGGGAVGDPIFRCALAAARAMPDRVWRLLIGGATPEARTAALREGAPANTVVEPARPDFRQMLHHAACSVSMAGYNTAMDLMQTGVPALLIPFDEGTETEQSLRARSLAGLEGIALLPSAALSPQKMAEAVAQLIAGPRRSVHQVSLDGATEAVRITERLWSART